MKSMRSLLAASLLAAAAGLALPSLPAIAQQSDWSTARWVGT
jgi:hypothetical protein